MRAMLVGAMLAALGVLAPVTIPASSAATATVEFVGEAGVARNIATPGSTSRRRCSPATGWC